MANLTAKDTLPGFSIPKQLDIMNDLQISLEQALREKIESKQEIIQAQKERIESQQEVIDVSLDLINLLNKQYKEMREKAKQIEQINKNDCITIKLKKQ